VYERYLRVCSGKALLCAWNARKREDLGVKKRWLVIRIKSASFEDTLDLVRVCLQLPSQNLANKCIANVSVRQQAKLALKSCNKKSKNTFKKYF
jgi:2-oxo-4-hydroxy-4-carboxy--5-ureidoimidazoline (OHCU) decarboxylase